MSKVLNRASCLLLCAMVIFLTGCPSDSKTNLTPLEQASEFFAGGDYERALESFESLVATEGSIASAGVAWCNLRLGNHLVAYSQFAALAADSLPDAYAGWSFVAWALNSPAQAISFASVTLDRDPEFVLSFDSRINAGQLVWIQAASYYQLGNYPATIERIQQLDAAFNPSLSDPSIASILAAKLQSLGSVHF